MTRLANGSLAEPQWPPLFVASARAALAGGLALAHLLCVRAPMPGRVHWPWLAGVVLGGVMAFPLGMGWAVRIVPASHAALIVGLLPLCTAALAAWWLGHRPRPGFWLASVAGAALMAVYALSASAGPSEGGGLSLVADGALLLGMLGASVAYVAGARLAREMPSSRVMSWSLVMAWPLTMSLAAFWWPQDIHSLAQARAQIHPAAWAGLAYVAVCSTWLGFFLWYAALAQDAMRASQVQLLQPILGMLFSAVLLGEAVPAQAWLFAVAVLAVVFAGQRLARAAPVPSITSTSQGPAVQALPSPHHLLTKRA
jgi:drug/metabolite transporter (DMT)-like permease